MNQKCETNFDSLDKTWLEYKSAVDEIINKRIDEGITKALHSSLFKDQSTVLIEERLAKMQLDLDKKNTELSNTLSSKTEKMHEDFVTLTKTQTSELQQLLQQWRSRVPNGSTVVHRGPPEHRYRAIKIKQAYRLGIKRKRSKIPRKILVELAEPTDRDIILQSTRQLTKIGNNGAPYFFNENANEEQKRRKADLHKYVKYLQEKGRRNTPTQPHNILN